MTTIGEAIIEVRGDVDGLDRDIRRGTSSSKMGAIGRTAGKGLAVGFAAAAGAVLAGGAFLKGAFDEAEEARKVGAQTAAVIKATGGIAGVSAKHVENLTGAMSAKVGIDDEAIQSGANLLLTFKNVRNEAGKGSAIFDRATKAAVDLSAAGFGSITGSSKMLGKALNDPVKGMSAMSRAGVTFTQQQQDQVKALVESGDTLAAQKIIMKEVESQVGGSAEAQATAADKMRVAWGNFKEDVGTALMPLLTRLMNFITTKVIPGLYKLGPVFEDIGAVVGPIIQTVMGALGSLRGGSGETSEKVEELKKTFSSVFASIKSIVTSAVSIIRSLWNAFGSTIVSYARSSFSNILQIIRGAFDVIAGIFKVISSVLKGDWRGAWEGIKQIVRGAWNIIKGIVKQGWNVIRSIFSAMGVVVKGIFRGIWSAVKAVASAAWNGITNTVQRGATTLVNGVKAIPGKIKNGALSLFRNAGRTLIDAFIGALKGSGSMAADFASGIWNAVKSAINSGIDTLNNLLEFDFKVKGIGFTVNAPDIGHLARGTNSWRGGLTEVGENGPELVNLPRGSEVIPAARSRAMKNAAGRAAGAGRLRLVSGTLRLDESGRAFIEGVAEEVVGGEAEFAGTMGRMR